MFLHDLTPPWKSMVSCCVFCHTVPFTLRCYLQRSQNSSHSVSSDSPSSALQHTSSCTPTHSHSTPPPPERAYTPPPPQPQQQQQQQQLPPTTQQSDQAGDERGNRSPGILRQASHGAAGAFHSIQSWPGGVVRCPPGPQAPVPAREAGSQQPFHTPHQLDPSVAPQKQEPEADMLFGGHEQSWSEGAGQGNWSALAVRGEPPPPRQRTRSGTVARPLWRRNGRGKSSDVIGLPPITVAITTTTITIAIITPTADPVGARHQARRRRNATRRKVAKRNAAERRNATRRNARNAAKRNAAERRNAARRNAARRNAARPIGTINPRTKNLRLPLLPSQRGALKAAAALSCGRS